MALYLMVLTSFLAFPFISSSLELESFINDDINEEMGKLARDVIEKYMTSGYPCVVVVSETLYVDAIGHYDTAPIVRIVFNNSSTDECEPELKFQLLPAFEAYCSNFVVQVSNPNCFIITWKEAYDAFVDPKINPRMLFLPFLPSTIEYGESLYSVNETNLLADILVAEFVKTNDTSDWCVDVFTNNFYQHPSQPGRTGSILLDTWHPGRGFENNVDLYPNKAQNLLGKELVVYAVHHYAPYTSYDPFDGTEVRLMKLFCEASNCSVVGTTDDDDWGDINPDKGIATGCSGFVYTGKADFCIGANYAWISYWPYLDFSVGYYEGELTVIVPKPQLLGGWSTPFLPFTLVLWSSIVLCVLMSTIGLYGITAATQKYAPRFRQQLEKNQKFLTLSDSFIRSVGMLVLQQPQQLVPGSPVRHLFTSLEIVYLVATTCYAAELYDYLTVPRTNKPIENAHDLADSNTIWMGNSIAYTLMIRHTDDPKLLKMVDNFRIYPDEKIISLGETGGYGIICERLIGGHFVELPFITNKFVEQSITMKEGYVQSPLYVYLRKGSPYTERLNQIIGRMLNGGLWYKWEEDCAANLLDYSKQQALLESTRKVTYPPKILKLSDLEGAFALYFIGLFASIMLFSKEVYQKNKTHAGSLSKADEQQRMTNLNKIHYRDFVNPPLRDQHGHLPHVKCTYI